MLNVTKDSCVVFLIGRSNICMIIILMCCVTNHSVTMSDLFHSNGCIVNEHWANIGRTDSVLE